MQRFHSILTFIFLVAFTLFAWPQLAVQAQQSGIVSPASNVFAYGDVPIYGTAVNPSFLRYELHYKAEPSNNDAYVYLHSNTNQIVNGLLGLWQTAHLPAGVYSIRLRVVKLDSNYDEYYAYNINFDHVYPTPTFTLIPTATPTPIPSQTPVPTFTPTPLPTPTLIPTFTSTPLPTPTLIPTFTSTPLPTLTLIPTFTSTPLPTPTLIPTYTPMPTPLPTLTLIPTFTSTPLPTLTLIPTFTSTPLPTPTLIPTFTPMPTPTFIPFPTATPPPTYTPLPTYTSPPIQVEPTATIPIVDLISEQVTEQIARQITATAILTATLDPLFAFATQLSTSIPTPTRFFMSTETPIPTLTPIPSATFTPAPQPTPIVGRVIQPDVAESSGNIILVPTAVPDRSVQQVNKSEIQNLESADEPESDTRILNSTNIGQLPTTVVAATEVIEALATMTTIPVPVATQESSNGVDANEPDSSTEIGTADVLGQLRNYLITGFGYGLLIGLVVALLLAVRWFLMRR